MFIESKNDYTYDGLFFYMVLLGWTSLFQFQKRFIILIIDFFSWVSGILFKLHTMTGTLLFLMSCFVYVRELLGDHIHCITDGADATGSLVMFFLKFVKALNSICGGCVPVVSLLTSGKRFISIMTSYLKTLYTLYCKV